MKNYFTFFLLVFTIAAPTESKAYSRRLSQSDAIVADRLKMIISSIARSYDENQTYLLVEDYLNTLERTIDYRDSISKIDSLKNLYNIAYRSMRGGSLNGVEKLYRFVGRNINRFSRYASVQDVLDAAGAILNRANR